MDITSYLLGKNASGGGGGNIDDYLINNNYYVYISSCIKKLPFAIDCTDLTSLSNFCQHCNNLEEVSFKNGGNITSARLAFDNCLSLMLLDVRDIIFSNMGSTSFNQMLGSSSRRVPYACLIIVKDDTEKQWFATNFANWANVKTVAEYEVE